MTKRKHRYELTDIPATPPDLSLETQAQVLYLAMAVRNAMEDFHVAHLSDAQMKVLNPIIRNALATALYAQQHGAENPLAQLYFNTHWRMIPPYWEPPRLLTDFSQAGFRARLEDDLKKMAASNPDEAALPTIAALAVRILSGVD